MKKLVLAVSVLLLFLFGSCSENKEEISELVEPVPETTISEEEVIKASELWVFLEENLDSFDQEYSLNKDNKIRIYVDFITHPYFELEEFFNQPQEALDRIVSLRLIESSQPLDLESLGKLRFLENLSLIEVSVESIDSIPSLSALESLTIRNCPVKELPRLSQLKNLKRLELEGTEIVDLNGMGPEKMELQMLRLNHNPFLKEISVLKNSTIGYLALDGSLYLPNKDWLEESFPTTQFNIRDDGTDINPEIQRLDTSEIQELVGFESSNYSEIEKRTGFNMSSHGGSGEEYSLMIMTAPGELLLILTDSKRKPTDPNQAIHIVKDVRRIILQNGERNNGNLALRKPGAREPNLFGVFLDNEEPSRMFEFSGGKIQPYGGEYETLYMGL